MTMDVTRRMLLATGAMGVAALAVPGRAAMQPWPGSVAIRAPGKRDYGAAIEAIRAYAMAELAATGLPGMTMSLVGDDGFAATLCLGWADLTARMPVRPDHLFEIGSISKSLVALTLWTMAGEGLVDLNAPLGRYLPASILPPEPVTAQQILNHSAGLSNFAPIAPRVPGARPWTGAAPGSHFYYSNTGYALLGWLIGAIAGRSHPAEIRRRVLAPIGMTDAAAVITHADRARMAQGYVPARDDIAPLTGTALVEGPWSEEDVGSGAVIATADDMAAYLRTVIALGRGKGGTLMSDDAVRALLAASIDAPDFGEKARYSSGFERTFIDGRPMLHHTGGMLMFTSSFDVDAAEGTGCFASVNGNLAEYRPVAVTAYATRVLRAARAGRKLPDAPDPLAFRRVDRPARFAGHWVAADGRVLEIVPDGSGIALVADGRRGRLEAMGGTRLISDLPGWQSGALEFSASAKGDGKSDKAPLDRLWYRDVAFGRDTAPPALPAAPDRLHALTGRYRSGDVWIGAMDIVTRGDRLVVLNFGQMVEDKGGYWRLDEDRGGLERFRFDTMVGGRAMRLSASGNDLWRFG